MFFPALSLVPLTPLPLFNRRTNARSRFVNETSSSGGAVSYPNSVMLVHRAYSIYEKLRYGKLLAGQGCDGEKDKSRLRLFWEAVFKTFNKSRRKTTPRPPPPASGSGGRNLSLPCRWAPQQRRPRSLRRSHPVRASIGPTAAAAAAPTTTPITIPAITAAVAAMAPARTVLRRYLCRGRRNSCPEGEVVRHDLYALRGEDIIEERYGCSASQPFAWGLGVALNILAQCT